MGGRKRPDWQQWRAAIFDPTPVNLTVAVVLFLLPWAVALVKVSHHHLDSGAVGLAATFSLGLPALWLTVAGFVKPPRPAPVSELKMADVADQLAIVVSAQWEAEATIRRLNDPYPLPVSWTAADPSPTDSWASLVKLASSGAGWPPPPPAGAWASDPDDLAGEGGELAAVLARVPTGRLVVLGEPGSGKTMLMVRLVLDLLARRTSGGRVPFLASVASWDPSSQELRDWLVARLSIDYPTLGGPPPTGRTETTQAEALLESKLILPVLDGLDEIPEEVRGSAISRINDALRPGEPVVVTCRSKEYRDAVQPQDGVEVTLRGAAAIQLRPLVADAVGGYLCDDAAGPVARARWAPVLAVLGTEAPAGQALSTPLMVGLARAIYNPRPGEQAGELRKPEELCGPEATDRKAVESLLFDAFIPAAYRNAHAGQRKAQDAEKWLVFLARHLERRIASPDLAWWQLSLAIPRLGLALAVGGAAGALAAGLVWAGFGFGLATVSGSSKPLGFWSAIMSAASIALVFGAAVGVLVGIAIMRRKSPAPARGIRWQPPKRMDIVVPAAVGAMVCFGVGIGFWSWSLATGGGGSVLGSFVYFVRLILVGAVGGVVLGAWPKLIRFRGVPLDLSSVASPFVMLRRARRTAIAIGAGPAVLVGGIAGVWAGTATRAVFGIADRIGFGIQSGILVGVIVGVTSSFALAVWPSYGVAGMWLALRHRLPWPLMHFLADAHRRGVLRQAGAMYQFRHIELQHRLVIREPEVATIGSYFDVRDKSGNTHRVTLVKVIDPVQGADEHSTPDSGKRLVGAVFKIKALSDSLQKNDADNAPARHRQQRADVLIGPRDHRQ